MRLPLAIAWKEHSLSSKCTGGTCFVRLASFDLLYTLNLYIWNNILIDILMDYKHNFCQCSCCITVEQLVGIVLRREKICGPFLRDKGYTYPYSRVHCCDFGMQEAASLGIQNRTWSLCCAASSKHSISGIQVMTLRVRCNFDINADHDMLYPPLQGQLHLNLRALPAAWLGCLWMSWLHCEAACTPHELSIPIVCGQRIWHEQRYIRGSSKVLA